MKNVKDIVRWRLCLGCGACQWACKEGRIKLYNFLDEGIRPVIEVEDCGSCNDCLKVCPVFECNYKVNAIFRNNSFPLNYQKKWGPVVGLWEGYAVDPEIRFKGASGGVLTALSLYCLEKKGIYGILHTGADPENPILNRTRLSRSRRGLLLACGSRYSPASVCNGLNLIESSIGSCVFIGRPVEIAALRNAFYLSPNLKEKISLMMSFFCAETPSTLATIALLSKMGLDSEPLSELRYRGNGWPGDFLAVKKSENSTSIKMSYKESWAFLQAYRPWATQLWFDGGGELADITCGDPWYKEPDGNDPGSSIILARTLRGKEIIEDAVRAGYLKVWPLDIWKLEESQWGLIQKKGSIWGRRLALKSLGLPIGNIKDAHLFHSWLKLSKVDKLKSFIGTYRRVLTRGFYNPLKIEGKEFQIVPPPFLCD